MLTVTAQSSDFTTAVDASLVVQVWHDETTAEGVQAMSEALTDCTRGGRKVFWLVVTSRPDGPEPAVRDAIAATMRRHQNVVHACALVFEGGGFAAATVRAVVAGLAMLSNHPFPYKVFPDVDAATTWFRSVAGFRVAGASLTASVADLERVRREHATRYCMTG